MRGSLLGFGFVIFMTGCPSPQIGPVPLCSVSRQSLMSRFIDGDATPRCLAFSPDGKTLAIGTGPGEKGSIILRDVETGKTVKKLATEFEVRQIVFAPDGNEIFAQGYYIHMNGSLPPTTVPHATRVDTVTGKTLDYCRWEWSELESLVRSTDGRSLVCKTSMPGEIRVGLVFGTSQQAQFPMNAAPLRIHNQAIKQVAVASDRRRVAFVDDDNKIRLCDLTKQQVAFVDDDNKIRVSDAAKQPATPPGGNVLQICEQITKLDGHKKQVKALLFTPDGKRLISAAGDTFDQWPEVFIWDLTKRELEAKVQVVPQGPICRLVVSLEGRYLAIGTRAVSESTVLGIYDLSTMTHEVVTRWKRYESTTFPTPAFVRTFEKLAWNTPVAFTPDSRSIAVVEYDGRIRTVDVKE